MICSFARWILNMELVGPADIQKREKKAKAKEFSTCFAEHFFY